MLMLSECIDKPLIVSLDIFSRGTQHQVGALVVFTDNSKKNKAITIKKNHHTQEAHQECEIAESSVNTKISDIEHLILLI